MVRSRKPSIAGSISNRAVNRAKRAQDGVTTRVGVTG
jgi:hypothetical protein